MSSNTSKYACPKCGNPNIQTERRPDGFHHCTECWYSWKNGEEVKPTNGDRIRQMNTSGLIDVIVCPYPDKVCIHRIMNGYACRCCKRDWLNAPAESEVENGSAKCEYCGKMYQKKKKAHRFCSLKCKDKWWNRERAEGKEYLHPQCEDNFNGEC